MKLPTPVLRCIRMLEEAGFPTYAVGGCVRDSLLGLTPHDYDLCTAATPCQIAQVFSPFSLVRSGEKHGTIGVVMEGSLFEITTFRTEGGYDDSRHPGWVRFVPSLEEDLKRRDFAVNAMAYHPDKGYVDPWGGQADLKENVLRAVGDPVTRFTEDALRILRGVRFAVRYNLTPEETTMQAMVELALRIRLLARERVFDELCKLLPLVKAEDLIRFAPVLIHAIPELENTVGFQQHTPHHLYDVYGHTARVVEAVPPHLSLRLAALLHDIGKPQTFAPDDRGVGHFPGHAAAGAELADTILRTLRAPTALREQVVFLVEHHMTPLPPDKKILRRRLGKYGEENIRLLLCLQQADLGSKGTTEDLTHFEEVARLLEEISQENACLSIRDLDLDGKDLLALGFEPGPALGNVLASLLEQVQDEVLPNEKEALLAFAKTKL